MINLIINACTIKSIFNEHAYTWFKPKDMVIKT